MNIIYNHQLYPSDTPLVGSANRGLRYGDGLFETLKVVNGIILHADMHFERLWKGLAILRFNLPPDFTPAILQDEIRQLCTANGHSTLGRVRLNVFRGDGGITNPSSSVLQYITESFSLDRAFASGDDPGLSAGIFTDGRKAMDAYSNLKSNNYLLYLMGITWAREHGLDECLILNAAGRVVEASIYNLFLVREGKIWTPPLSEGAVEGIQRRYLMSKIPEWGWSLVEAPIDVPTLLVADEIFLSNAIAGIRWVREISSKSYGREVSAQLSILLQQALP